MLTGIHLPLLALILAIISLAGGQPIPRLRISIAAAAGLLVYSDWRVSNFVAQPSSGGQACWLSFFLVVELLSLADFGIFLLLMSRTIDRRSEADQHAVRLAGLPIAELPKVDVFITTYDEEWSILEKTIVGAGAIDYPRKQIWLLDDGDRTWLAEKCRSLEISYLSRQENSGGKAGNQNHALAHTDAPFFATFDADFIPRPNFLWRTLGFFVDPKVAIVQTPQCFYNPDAIHNNLMIQDSAPGELRLFYDQMQACRDAWDAAFYVGSCAVIRRDALEHIGGFVTGFATEDQITSVALLAQGYLTRYLGENLAFGLASESLLALSEQRNRWARGAIQLLFHPDGPLGRQMSFVHRLFFLQSYWLIGFFTPIIFACAPMLFWRFGLRPISEAEPQEALFVPLLNYLIIASALYRLSNRLHWPVIAQATQLYLCFRTLPTIIATLIKPFGKPIFPILRSTPKGIAAKRWRVDFRTGGLLFIVMATTIWGMIDAARGDPEMMLTDPLEVCSWLLWTVLTLSVVGLATLASIELPWRRSEERFRLKEPAMLRTARGLVPVHLTDLSLGGAGVSLAASALVLAGEPMALIFGGLPEFPCGDIRRSLDGRQLVLQFHEMPSKLRIPLIVYIFLHPLFLTQRNFPSITHLPSRIARLFWYGTSKVD